MALGQRGAEDDVLVADLGDCGWSCMKRNKGRRSGAILAELCVLNS